MIVRLRLTVHIDDQRVVILPHATRRYGERASRHDDVALVATELAMLLDHHGHIEAVAPCWVYPPARGHAWLLLGDDIAFPLELAESGVLGAMTCLCRSGVPDRRRARRTRRRGRVTGKKAAAERRERRDLRIPELEEAA
jgi:hypothetical protein